MNRKTIELSEIKMSYYDEGEGEPILMLHGFPDSADVWRNMIPRLVDEGYRVIAPDMRGFGETEAPVGKENYTVAKIMKDFLELKALLKIEVPMKLIAHDWGASIGWSLVSFYPDQFESYVPISVGHPYAYALDGGFEQQKKGWYTMAFQFEGMAEKMFSQNDFAAFRVFTQDNPELDINWLPDMRREGRFTAALNLYRANLEPHEDDVKVPRTPLDVMGFYGEDDLYLSESQMKATGKYTDGEFGYVKIDGGHWLPLEQPELLLKDILQFYIDEK